MSLLCTIGLSLPVLKGYNHARKQLPGSFIFVWRNLCHAGKRHNHGLQGLQYNTPMAQVPNRQENKIPESLKAVTRRSKGLLH